MTVLGIGVTDRDPDVFYWPKREWRVSIRASLDKTSLCQFRKLVCFTIDICKTIPYNDVKIKYRKGATR